MTHLLPLCDNPLFFNSPFRVATVSPFQFLCEDNRTAEARLALCCCIGLADTALAVPAEADAEEVVVDLAARKRPVDTLRRIIAYVYMYMCMGMGVKGGVWDSAHRIVISYLASKLSDVSGK
jgi:hypothetical protein